MLGRAHVPRDKRGAGNEHRSGDDFYGTPYIGTRHHLDNRRTRRLFHHDHDPGGSGGM
jgi:hypothetical protein